MKNLIYFLLFIVSFSSCNLFKKATDEGGFSSEDFPYIEKFHEAVRLKIRGQVDQAIAKFEQCLAIRQDDDAVFYALSELYLSKSDLNKSAACIQQASNIDPKNIWYTQELAYMYFEAGEFELSVKYFQKLLNHEARNVEWLYGYAECLVKLGKVADAIKALDKTEDQIGVFPDLSIQKSNLYLQLNQPDKAEDELLEAKKLFPSDAQLLVALVDFYFQQQKVDKAIVLLQDLVAANPENGRAHLALADIYQQQGKMSLAYDEFKKAIKCADVDIDTKMKILINIYESTFKPDDEVFEVLQYMVDMYPTEAKAHSIRGDFYLKVGNNEEALTAYKNALLYDQSQYPIWNQVMLMEYQAGKFKELYLDSKSCLDYFPSVATVYLLNGIGAVQSKFFQEAIETLSLGRELVGNDKVMDAEMLAQIGEAYFGLKNNDKATFNYELAIEKAQDNLLIKNNYAYRLAQSKLKLDLALKLIDEVLMMEGNEANYLDTKGLVLFQMDKFSDALNYFINALEMEPSDKLIVEHNGDAYFKTGNVPKALEFWVKAREMGSANKVLDKKIEKKEYYEPIY
jgi:tetratricopeptide (TPR) repeat protein